MGAPRRRTSSATPRPRSEPQALRGKGEATEAAVPLVRVDRVSKAYREGAVETSVLRDASLELPRGETTSLSGVSGSGKTTLISLLAGLLVPDSGRVVFGGQDIADLDDAGRARLRAGRIGVVLQ